MDRSGDRKLIDFSTIKLILGFIVILWIVFIFDRFLPLERFGIQPRQLGGLIGVIASPLIHANLQHIIANCGGLLIFGGFCGLLEGKRILSVVAGVTIIGGLLTWLLARPANHIGASGVIFGLFGYLMSVGFFQRRWNFILASLACLVGFGSMIFGVLPRYPSVSWESHLFGFVAGLLMAKWRNAWAA